MNSIMPYTPQESLDMVRALSAIVQELRTTEFKAEVDYGIIPGTSKPTLLLPGMEKLMRALRLRAEYIATEKMIDFENGIFFYEFECRLYEVESGLCVGTAIGSANSRETKWRWRTAERVCPNCGKPAIIKGKEEYGGGWVCFTKKEGCNSKFKDNDPAIVDQIVGRIENPDIADQANTICKIAQKRSLSSAIKCVANVSAFFTVDIEDMPRHSLGSFDAQPAAPDNVVEGSFTPVVVEKPAEPKNAPKPNTPPQNTPLISSEGFSVETGRNFMGWAKRAFNFDEDTVRKTLDHAAGRELTSLTMWPYSTLDAAAALVAADQEYSGDHIRGYLESVKKGGVKLLSMSGKPFTAPELEHLLSKAMELNEVKE